MEIEEFKIKISKEKGIFEAEIFFQEEEKLVTQASNIFQLYDRISEILKLREE